MTLEILEGAGVAVASGLLGRFTPRHRRRNRLGDAVCGCRHHLSFHDEKGKCHQKVERVTGISSGSSWHGKVEIQHRSSFEECTCVRYIGQGYDAEAGARW